MLPSKFQVRKANRKACLVWAFLLGPLINFYPLAHQGKQSYFIEYLIDNKPASIILPENQVSIRIDEEWESEYYDPLSQTAHLSPGRILGNK